MNRFDLGNTDQETTFLPYQRTHSWLENLGLEELGLEEPRLKKFSLMSEMFTQFPGKARRYLKEKKLETISELDTRKLVYHLSPSKKLQISILQLICKTNPEYAADLALRHFSKPRRRLSYTMSDLPKGAIPFTLPYRNGNLRGYSWGEGERTVYLVHGWESLTSLMTKFVEPLLSRGFRVVAFDAPGHGHSDTQDTDILDFSHATAHLIRHMGEAHGIIAHSCGGAATTLMLKNNPDITPKKVVLVAPMPSLQKHVEVFQELVGLPLNVFTRFIEGLEQRLDMNILEADAALAVKHVKAEGLVIHDLDDPLIPHSAGYWIAKNWQGSSLMTTIGLGHLKILQDQGVISSTVHFLESV